MAEEEKGGEKETRWQHPAVGKVGEEKGECMERKSNAVGYNPRLSSTSNVRHQGNTIHTTFPDDRYRRLYHECPPSIIIARALGHSSGKSPSSISKLPPPSLSTIADLGGRSSVQLVPKHGQARCRQLESSHVHLTLEFTMGRTLLHS